MLQKASKAARHSRLMCTQGLMLWIRLQQVQWFMDIVQSFAADDAQRGLTGKLDDKFRCIPISSQNLKPLAVEAVLRRCPSSRMLECWNWCR